MTDCRGLLAHASAPLSFPEHPQTSLREAHIPVDQPFGATEAIFSGGNTAGPRGSIMLWALLLLGTACISAHDADQITLGLTSRGGASNTAHGGHTAHTTTNNRIVNSR